MQLQPRQDDQEKKGYTTTVVPSSLSLSPDPEVVMVNTISLGKQGKRVYTIGPEGMV